MEVRQNKPPQTSHNHDGFSLWTGSGYDDSGGHSKPYEPLTDHWSDYANYMEAPHCLNARIEIPDVNSNNVLN
jgi:hypothetical protein